MSGDCVAPWPSGEAVGGAVRDLVVPNGTDDEDDSAQIDSRSVPNGTSESDEEWTEEGMTQREIAAVLGVTQMTIQRDLDLPKAVTNVTSDEVVDACDEPKTCNICYKRRRLAGVATVALRG